MSNPRDMELQLWEAIYERLTDEVTGTLYDDEVLPADRLVGGIYNVLSKDAISSTRPFVVFQIEDVSQMDGYRQSVHRVAFNVNTFVPGMLVGTPTPNPMEVGSKINEIIKGNWHQQSSRIPTYGLDRHLAQTKVGDKWLFGQMEYINTLTNHEPPDWYHWVHRFSILMTSKAPA